MVNPLNAGVQLLRPLLRPISTAALHGGLHAATGGVKLHLHAKITPAACSLGSAVADKVTVKAAKPLLKLTPTNTTGVAPGLGAAGSKPATATATATATPAKPAAAKPAATATGSNGPGTGPAGPPGGVKGSGGPGAGPAGPGSKPPAGTSPVVSPADSARAKQVAAQRFAADQLDLWHCAESRRMSGPPMAPGASLSGVMYRFDSFPHEAVTPPTAAFPGQPKSHVDASGAVHPAGTELNVSDHVGGQFPAKGQSGLTSFSAVVADSTQGWGNSMVTARPAGFNAVLTPPLVLQHLRLEGLIYPELRDQAKNKDGSAWTALADPMFTKLGPSAQLDAITRMVMQGIDPAQTSFTESERRQVYAVLAQEVLAVGSSAPNTATVTPVVPKPPAGSAAVATATAAATTHKA